MTLLHIIYLLIVSLHASVWGGVYLVIRTFERERVQFLREKIQFQGEQAAFVTHKAIHAAGKSSVLCNICSACGKVTHTYDNIDGKIVCADCQAK